MLSCKDITEKANEYLDKELSLGEKVKFRMHLFVCVNCRRYISQLRTTILTLGRMNNETANPIKDAEIENIVNLLKEEAKSSRAGPHSQD